MRMFWSIFFLGSMLLIGLDVRERRQSAFAEPSEVPERTAPTMTDPVGWPTPNP